MKLKTLLAILMLALPMAAHSQKAMLVNYGNSDYTLVIPDKASPLEQYAANDLAALMRMTAGANYRITPILSESEYRQGPAIFIGSCRQNKALFAKTHFDHDGYALRSNKDNLHLLGYSDTATCYAVYHFAEHYLGSHLYTPSALEVTQCKLLEMPKIDEYHKPDFDYREVLYYYPNHSKRYALWHRLHTRQDLARDWGMFVHTFQHLVPADKYFNQHPEWFSEINGRRVRDGQLCLSNPEVLDILCMNLIQEMRKNPNASIWSVSNNDNYNNCTCPECRKADSIYGGPSGTLIHFINQVARRFPDKTISTLAYQYTRQAPQNSAVRPDSNVNIMFCSIESGRQEAIATAPGEASFRNDMEQWSAMSDNIFLWDYVVQFRNFWDPFPNLHVLQPNLQYFHQHGVKQMFEQASGADNKTSWMELRTYLIAQLMWDVNANADSLTHQFCQGYYGPAARSVEQFLKEMTEALTASGQRLDIYGYPVNGRDGYLRPAMLDRYRQLMAEAYASLAGTQNPTMSFADEPTPYTYADRLRYLELSLDFAILELAASDLSETYSFFIKDEEERTVNQEMVDRLDRFVRDCRKLDIGSLAEMGYTPEEFRENIEKYLYKSADSKSLSYKKPVSLTHAADPRYPANGIRSLTDGIAGILNYSYNWLGFYGTDLEAVVDLEYKQPINEISMDFFFYPLSWIFLPQDISYYVSNNGKSWREVYHIRPENPQILAKPTIKTFRADDLHANARYVKVVAKVLPKIPEWHRAVGNPAWLFTDEIVIK